MAREIPLTQGKVAIVDDEDYDWLMQWKWILYQKPSTNKTEYAMHCTSKYVGNYKSKTTTTYMHRLILEQVLGRKLSRNEYSDHEDGNGLNNRRYNLRLSSPTQSARNKPTRSNKAVPFRGVTKRPGYDKWRARIRIDGHLINLGDFDSPEKASAIYEEEARRRFGTFYRP